MTLKFYNLNIKVELGDPEYHSLSPLTLIFISTSRGVTRKKIGHTPASRWDDCHQVRKMILKIYQLMYCLSSLYLLLYVFNYVYYDLVDLCLIICLFSVSSVSWWQSAHLEAGVCPIFFLVTPPEVDIKIKVNGD